MSKIETGIRALNLHELGLVSGAGEKNAFAGASAHGEAHAFTPPDDDDQPGPGMILVIGLCVLFGM